MLWRTLQRLGAMGLSLVAVLGCADPDGLATPVAETCGARAAVSGSFERDFPADGLDDVRLGACGELTWRDTDGVSQLGSDFGTVRQLSDDALTVALSPAGDQMLSVRQDGQAEWRDTAAPDRVERFEADRYGFVRDGDRSRAWFCGGQSLGTVGPDGVQIRARVGTCDVWSAEAAPVLAYVNQEFELSLIDLRSDDVTSMAEVPFVAASNDEVRLSRDGRVLFHQPRNSPVARVAVFDSQRSEGDRLLGAPESNRGIGGLQHARLAGHTTMFPGNEGFYVVTPNGFLNVYSDVVFLSLSPDGSEIALVAGTTNAAGRFDVLVSDLDAATIRTLSSASSEGVAVQPDFIRASWEGNAVVADGRSPAFGTRSTRMSFRWDTREFTQSQVQTGATRPVWVSESGAVLVRDNDGAAQLGLVGQPVLHRWDTSGFSVAGSLVGDRVLLRLSTEDGTERLILASTVRAESVELGTYQGLRTLMVDHDATRFVTVSNSPDPSVPAGILRRLVARAMPPLP